VEEKVVRQLLGCGASLRFRWFFAALGVCADQDAGIKRQEKKALRKKMKKNARVAVL